MRRTLLYMAMLVLVTACGPRRATETTPTIYVSIAPLKMLVAEIVGDDFETGVLVPPGASPETFEPTPRQFMALNRAQLVFNVGFLEFETALLGKMEEQEKIVDLNRGVEPITGSCCGHDRANGHAHGIDPHLWLSPRALRQMAANAYEAIHAAWPDSAKYTRNYERLSEKLEALDRRTAEKIASSGVKSFVIYHPALTYYARDYGVEQVAIETDGKEPSARQLGRLIGRARKDGVTKVLYQSQFPASTVAIIASDIGAEAIGFDPLQEDVVANIDEITEILTKP